LKYLKLKVSILPLLAALKYNHWICINCFPYLQLGRMRSIIITLLLNFRISRCLMTIHYWHLNIHKYQIYIRIITTSLYCFFLVLIISPIIFNFRNKLSDIASSSAITTLALKSVLTGDTISLLIVFFLRSCRNGSVNKKHRSFLLPQT
jgi:hypothetical protein